MSIEFDFARWPKIKADARRWWTGELDRPLIQMRLWGRAPGRPAPGAGPIHKGSFYDLNLSAERLVDRWDYDLSTQRCLGDAFPAVWLDFGPGALAALLGARYSVRPHEHTVWFHAPKEQPIGEVRFERRDDPPLVQRMIAIARAACERWGGLVQVGITDLGGTVDVLSTFRPGEGLMFDMCDEPEPVKRLTWELHEHWFHYFQELNEALRPENPGYTAWTPLFSEAPYYMLQCDFCYMIGPKMFDEFIKPELAAACRRLVNPFYHLDGKGQLPHLDSLLAIPELKGIQWVPGDGQPNCAHWPEVYRRIRAAGKLVQVLGGMREFDAVVDQLGSAQGLVLLSGAPLEQEREVERWLARYGVV